MLKLSIITINLNNGPGLKKTIESVVRQSSRNFEYIIIDGGSTDESTDIIKYYETKINYWVSEPDKGIYHAMNKGIVQANGEFCQFLNSGDWLVDANVVERMLTGHITSSVLIGNLLKLQPKNKIIRDTGQQGNISLYTLYRGTINHSSSYIKKKLFLQYGLYDESLKIVSDWKFFLITVGLNDETVYYKNIDVSYFNIDGISNKSPLLNQQERRYVLDEILPKNVLVDYDNYWIDIDQMNRLKRIKFIRFFIWLLDRTLFKIEQIRIKQL